MHKFLEARDDNAKKIKNLWYYELHRSIDKNLREVDHVLLHRQVSHRLCSQAAPLLARAGILCLVDEHSNLQTKSAV